MSDRTCAYCHGPVSVGKRTDAKYCSDLCKGRFHRFGPRETATNGFPRTPDTGTKVYLLANDLAALEAGPPYSSRVLRKLAEARDRLQRKEP